MPHSILSMFFPLLIAPSAGTEAGGGQVVPVPTVLVAEVACSPQSTAASTPSPGRAPPQGHPPQRPPQEGRTAPTSTHLGPPQWLRTAGKGLRTRGPRPLFWTQWRGRGCRGQKFLQLPPDRWTELDKQT